MSPPFISVQPSGAPTNTGAFIDVALSYGLGSTPTPPPVPTLLSISPAQSFASWGTQVVAVTGSNLTGATSLQLNGLSVQNLQVVSSNVLVGTASVSTNAGTGSVSVTTPNGTAALSNAWTYNDDPLTIFSGSSNLDAWWEPRSSTSVTGSLATMNDLTTNGNNWSQISLAKYHAVDSLFNGMPTLELLGVTGSWMRIDSLKVNNGSNFNNLFTWFVMRGPTGGVTCHICDYDHVPINGEWVVGLQQFAATPTANFAGVIATYGSNFTGNACTVAGAAWVPGNGGHITSSIAINNVNAVTASTSTTINGYASGRSYSIGAPWSDTINNFLSGGIASAIVAHSAPTALQLAQLQAYAHLAFGI